MFYTDSIASGGSQRVDVSDILPRRFASGLWKMTCLGRKDEKQHRKMGAPLASLLICHNGLGWPWLLSTFTLAQMSGSGISWSPFGVKKKRKSKTKAAPFPSGWTTILFLSDYSSISTLHYRISKKKKEEKSKRNPIHTSSFLQS